MTEPLISVLVLTYHPQKEALSSTLRSIVLQKDCDFELIVADDGSGDFFQEEIREFLDAQGVSQYKILAHAENQGTVRNILDGVKAARGTYIKPISPGDYLYDDTTLRDIAAFMQLHQASAAFGQMVFYTYGTDLQVKNLVHPVLDGIYRTDRYSFRKAMKQQTVFSDFICGASAVYERNALMQALETIAPAVRYAEDAVFQLFAAQGTRIYAIPRLVVWYEHGSGISSQRESRTFTRIEEDFYRFYYRMAELFPKNPYIKRACRLWELRKNGTGAKNLFSKLRLDKILFSLRVRCRKRLLKPPSYSEKFFRQCHMDTDLK